MSFFSRFRRIGNAFSSGYSRRGRPYNRESRSELLQQVPEGWSSFQQEQQIRLQDQLRSLLWQQVQPQIQGQLVNWFQQQQPQIEPSNFQQGHSGETDSLWQWQREQERAQLQHGNYDIPRNEFRRQVYRQPFSELYGNQFKIHKKSRVIDSRKSHLSTTPKNRKKKQELLKQIKSYEITNHSSDEDLQPGVERSQANYLFLNFILSSHHCGSATISYERLYPDDPEYCDVDDLITNKRNFIVDAIFKIDNPLLKQAYKLKKEQKKLEFSHTDELKLFHGTTWINAENICKSNFNWRKCKTHKYGKGISFSMNCNYAATYCDEMTKDKVMILAKVLVGKSCLGDKNMVLPPDGYDTSRKSDNDIVVVKYDDNEFLPIYKIYFHLLRENVRR